MNPSFIDNIPRKNASWAEYFIFPVISRGVFNVLLRFGVYVRMDSTVNYQLGECNNVKETMQPIHSMD
jgi:hypothetical protein